MKDSEIKQFYKPYQSTIRFEKFLKSNRIINSNTKKIIDIGTGIGSNLDYFSKKNKQIFFLGTDYNEKRLKIGKKLIKNPKVHLQKLDILKSKQKINQYFDLTLCIHTLCVFKRLDDVLKNICKIGSKFIAINSLFYEGDLDVLIHIRDHTNKKISDKNPDSDFNIFSLNHASRIFKKYKYKIILKKPYFPSKKINKPSKGKRGSYTIKTEMNKFTTFSGPVHLPWYFVVAKKIK
jgi:hypothetical protein